jgi:hypothetical protein
VIGWSPNPCPLISHTPSGLGSAPWNFARIRTGLIRKDRPNKLPVFRCSLHVARALLKIGKGQGR